MCFRIEIYLTREYVTFCISSMFYVFQRLFQESSEELAIALHVLSSERRSYFVLQHVEIMLHNYFSVLFLQASAIEGKCVCKLAVSPCTMNFHISIYLCQTCWALFELWNSTSCWLYTYTLWPNVDGCPLQMSSGYILHNFVLLAL